MWLLYQYYQNTLWLFQNQAQPQNFWWHLIAYQYNPNTFSWHWDFSDMFLSSFSFPHKTVSSLVAVQFISMNIYWVFTRTSDNARHGDNMVNKIRRILVIVEEADIRNKFFQYNIVNCNHKTEQTVLRKHRGSIHNLAWNLREGSLKEYRPHTLFKL